jgi:AraC-like DNA-binding protein
MRTFSLERGESDELIPAMQNWGNDFAALNRDFEQAVGLFLDAAAARHGAAVGYSVAACRVLAGAGSARNARASRRSRSDEDIELRLGEPIGVASLAQQLDISHNHLTRLFQAEVKTSVVGYIRQRRMERARHL